MLPGPLPILVQLVTDFENDKSLVFNIYRSWPRYDEVTTADGGRILTTLTKSCCRWVRCHAPLMFARLVVYLTCTLCTVVGKLLVEVMPSVSRVWLSTTSPFIIRMTTSDDETIPADDSRFYYADVKKKLLFGRMSWPIALPAPRWRRCQVHQKVVCECYVGQREAWTIQALMLAPSKEVVGFEEFDRVLDTKKTSGVFLFIVLRITQNFFLERAWGQS